MERAAKVRWLRILAAGVSGEVILGLVTAAIFSGEDAESLLPVVIPPATFVIFALVGYWAARRAEASHILHGVLVGLVGILLYAALTLAALLVPGAPELDFQAMLSPASLLAHALKIVGGTAGAYLVSRGQEPSAA